MVFSLYVLAVEGQWESAGMPWVTHGGVLRHTRETNNLSFNRSVSSQIIQSPHVVKSFGSLDEVQLNFLKSVFLSELKLHGFCASERFKLELLKFHICT